MHRANKKTTAAGQSGKVPAAKAVLKWNPISEGELEKIIQGMKAAEKQRFFDDMFCQSIPEVSQHPAKEDLLKRIQPEMKLYKPFFLDIYGYELSYPGFREQALSKLEECGSSKARQHYDNIIAEYEDEKKSKIKSVAKWLKKEWERRYENYIKKQQGKAVIGVNGAESRYQFTGLPQDW